MQALELELNDLHRSIRSQTAHVVYDDVRIDARDMSVSASLGPVVASASGCQGVVEQEIAPIGTPEAHVKPDEVDGSRSRHLGAKV
ncbi:hypothetical protein D2V04_00335 [Pelagerythrobacter aerophilus]|uniref:Uncharacterized protein n=1 Tax=Pelagerythrobacter aerophilus TaxID=2306995 RepID=A0A418NMC7_9SPHN|nr:hypothetical protein D2V04_00335 [Pelagerythrobacter aerophilus]